MIKQEKLLKVFIWGFLLLYLLVAGISFIHAMEFFSIGNPNWMAGTLAFAFELGLALSLAAILLSDANKSKKLPWILMIVMTFVQVVGNVYSTFKFISLSDVDYYVYLQKPLLFWIEEVSQDTVQVIISWIIGAILPIVALFMTDMVASNMKNLDAYKKNNDTQTSESIQYVPQLSEEEKKEREKLYSRPYNLENDGTKDEPAEEDEYQIDESVPKIVEDYNADDGQQDDSDNEDETVINETVEEKEAVIPEVVETKEAEEDNLGTDVNIEKIEVHEQPIHEAIKRTPTAAPTAIENARRPIINNIPESSKTDLSLGQKQKPKRVDDPYYESPEIHK